MADVAARPATTAAVIPRFTANENQGVVWQVDT